MTFTKQHKAKSAAVMQTTNNVLYSQAIAAEIPKDARSALMRMSHALLRDTPVLTRWEGFTKKSPDDLQVRYIIPLNTVLTPYEFRSEEGDGRRRSLNTTNTIGGVSLDRYVEAAYKHSETTKTPFERFTNEDFVQITADVKSQRGSIRKFIREGAKIQSITLNTFIMTDIKSEIRNLQTTVARADNEIARLTGERNAAQAQLDDIMQMLTSGTTGTAFTTSKPATANANNGPVKTTVTTSPTKASTPAPGKTQKRRRGRPSTGKPKSVLTKIEGVGPAMAHQFEEAGITSPEEVVRLTDDEMATIFAKCGPRFRNVDAETMAQYREAAKEVS